MINLSANSLNPTFYTLNSMANSKTDATNLSTNSNQNAILNSQISHSNSNPNSSIILNASLNFAQDKSNAVGEVLGYGVDKDGYFTSDLNEAAGISKSFKIHAKQIKSFYDTYTSTMPTHNSIDIAKTLNNAYKAFERDMGANLQQNYSADEFTKLSATNKRLSDKLNSINALQKALDESSASAEKMSWGTFFELSKYTQNERVDKTALFALYINSDFIEGEVNMYGKIMGLDKTMNKAQVQELQNFINDNKLLGLFGVGAGAFGFEGVMRASDLSIDEFKEKWLEYKAKAEKEFELTNEKQNTEQNLGANLANMANAINLENHSEQNSAKKRLPIQVISKSQTYTNLYFAKYKSFLEDTQKEQMFEILFGKEKHINFLL